MHNFSDIKQTVFYSWGREAYKRNRRFIRHYSRLITDFKAKIVVLVYHRVLPKSDFNPLKSVTSVSAFTRQIDTLLAKYPVISLSEAARQCREQKAKSKVQVVLTFDDGYADNYNIAFPILKKKGIPAAFFLPTEYIDKDKPMWDWEIVSALSKPGAIDKIDLCGYSAKREQRETQLSFALRVFDAMKSMRTKDRQELLDGIKALGSGFNPSGPDDRCLTWEQAKAMSDNGMEIGGHGASHCSLSRVPYEEAVKEIAGCKIEIERNIGKRCAHFAFPFGSSKDYNRDLIRCVMENGFDTCMLNTHGYNYTENSFCFKRVIMDDLVGINRIFG